MTKSFNESTIINLKVQLEEAKKVEEVIKSQLKMKEEKCEQVEAETVSLKEEIENTMNTNTNLMRAPKF